jgi:E3 ubiquitin-protein ligase TRIP12
MSNEDTLPGFQFRALYPPLRDCLADENDANAEIALTACRALTYLMEALPRSAMQVVEATPIFLSKVKFFSPKKLFFLSFFFKLVTKYNIN